MQSRPTGSTDQHYVPQLLLLGFATKKRKQLYVYDKKTGKMFRSSIRNIACERNFYRIEKAKDPDRIDNWLRKLEEQAAPVISSIRTHKTISHLQPAERVLVAGFIAVQHLRTRHHRELWADLNKQMADALRKMGADPNAVRNFREFNESEMHELTTEDVPRLSYTLLPHILDKSWILLSAAPGTEFWIGDHPVVLDNTINPGDGVRGTLGFGVRGIEIYLPVSTELTLGCLCSTIPAIFITAKQLQGSGLPTLLRNEEFLNAFTGSSTLQLDIENMKYHNSLQAIKAERFVFCEHPNFGLLEEMLKSDPDLKSGPRLGILGKSRGGN